MNGCEDCRNQRFMWAFWDSDPLRSLQQKAMGGEAAVTIKIDQVLVCFMWLQVRIHFTKHQAIELVDYHDWLVVWNMNFIVPFHIWDVILPIDFNSIIFEDGYCTTNQVMINHH